ncbi:synaptophysin-like protein 1 [Rhinatrema bivittatum]|uniref:synaptophysin-like protein 1 n=1 Tax=Rhinatrema bivittatum TaxID=194408 RepID=UPI00112ED090|nr:synaptophysin-like protein 1 [Rhinatrema bivittatum]
MAGLQVDFTPLKEPLGFIKVLQWIFSIFAFATCGGYSGKTEFSMQCKNTTFSKNVTATASFGYPFQLNNVKFAVSEVSVCGQPWTDLFLRGGYSSSSQFFVSVAVFAFLYCIGALVLYVGYMHMYRESRKLPMTDFVITIIFAFLWLVSSSAWAKALTDIKLATDPASYTGDYCPTSAICKPGGVSSMGSLNVSVVFGFLNLILWGGNAWFAYKETSLHTPPPGISTDKGPGSVPSPAGMP